MSRSEKHGTLVAISKVMLTWSIASAIEWVKKQNIKINSIFVDKPKVKEESHADNQSVSTQGKRQKF